MFDIYHLHKISPGMVQFKNVIIFHVILSYYVIILLIKGTHNQSNVHVVSTVFKLK